MPKLSKRINEIIILLSFSIYIFFWSLKINDIDLRYAIFFPIYFLFLNRSYYFSYIKKKFFIIFFLILLIHYFLVNFLNNTTILFEDIFRLFLIFYIFVVYFCFKKKIEKNFELILYFYYINLIIFSVLKSGNIDVGSCNYYIAFFLKQFGISISNGIFQENSHLATMNLAALFSSLYYYFYNNNKKLLFLGIISLAINILNISTTFILGSILISSIFLLKNLKKEFKILLILNIIFTIIFFISNNYCHKKITDFRIENVNNNILDKRINLTTSVYERSLMVSIFTIKKYPFGWGHEGHIKATKKFYETHKDKNPGWPANTLNLKDGLGNIFKLIAEYGIFSIIVFYAFIKYLVLNRLNAFKIFLISIFIVQSFRGAGYINGAFAIAIFEILAYTFYNKQSPSK